MNKKFSIIAAVIALTVIGLITYKGSKFTWTRPPATPTVDTAELNFFTIHDFKQRNLVAGDYSMEGYVVKTYTCPPCADGNTCKPCMKPNIVISENNEQVPNYILSNNELLVYTNDTAIKMGVKYKFKVRIVGTKTSDEFANDIELVDYSLAK